MTLPKLEPSARVGDQVFEAVRSAIISGEFPSGHRLRIRDIADELGTSTMPVREAIKRLEEIGLAEAMPYRGAVVKTFTNKELLDLYSTRRLLEVEAAILGAAQAVKEDLDAMATEYAAMEASIRDADAVSYLAHDEAFLLALYGPADNETLIEMIRVLWGRCQSYKLFGARRELESGDPESLLRHQRDLLRATTIGDAESAGKITETSLNAAIQRIHGALPGTDAGLAQRV